MRLASLFVLTSCAVAQASQPLEIQRFLRDLHRNTQGTFVFLEDPEGEWRKAVMALGASDELEDLGLPWWAIHPTKEASIHLFARQRYGWDTGPHWAYVDATGEILFQGQTLPSAAGLRDQMEGAGIHGPAQVLRDFLSKHPDHLEAKTQWIGSLVSRASQRTRRLMAPPKKTAVTSTAPGSEGSPAAPAFLDSEDDERIWGEASRQVLGHFRSGDWAVGGVGLGFIEMDAGRHSRLLRDCIQKCLPLIEAELERQPTQWQFWFLWMNLSDVIGGRSLQPLLDRLSPLPGSSPGQWPPSAVLRRYVQDARNRRDWNAIQDVLMPRWDELRLQDSHTTWLRVEKGKAPEQVMGMMEWETLLDPLVESCIRQGNLGDADRIVSEAVMRLGWVGIKEKAYDLAKRCQQPAFASRWASLTPAKGQG